MFDIDNLDTFLAKEVVKEPVPEGVLKHRYVPKSREQRLKEFYDKQGGGGGYPGKDPSAVAPEVNAEAVVESDDLRLRGNECHSKGDYEAAVEFYTTAIKILPSSTLHSNRAASYMMLGWWDQALRDCKHAMRRDDNNDRARERLARCYLSLDKLPEALNACADAEARVPSPEKVSQGIKRVRWMAENIPVINTEEAARKLQDQVNKSERLSPMGYRVRMLFVRTLMEKSDAIENKRKIRPGIPINRWRPKDEEEEIVELTPFADEALKETASLLEDFPDDGDVRYWRGRALARLGKQEDAQKQWRRGLRDGSEHEEMHRLVNTMNTLDDLKRKGNEFFNDGEWNEAIDCYSQAIDMDSEARDVHAVAALHCNRCAAYRKRGDFKKALEDANAALALRPKYLKALFRRGMILVECGRAAEGLTELKVVQRADHTLETLNDWLRRAHCWLAKSRHEKNYYRVLGAPMDATQDELRKCYRKACLMWHPDKNPSEEAAKRFEGLKEAFEFLSDEDQRKVYDYGIWRDRPVDHHLKERQKVKDMYDDNMEFEDTWGARKKSEGGCISDTDSEDEKVIDMRYPNKAKKKDRGGPRDDEADDLRG